MPKKGKTDSTGKTDSVEVWLVEPGQGRPPFAFEPKQIEFLPADLPLPQAGDLVLLPRKVTGDSKAQTFAWGGTLAPFRVVEREHVYFRARNEKHDPANPKPAQFVRTLVYVRRLTAEEYGADPGQAAG
jgi:hypothetical protein